MAYADEVLTDSPTGYWKLNESSGATATDSSGNGHTGTYQNTPTYGVTGPVTGDTAVTFDSAQSEHVTTTTLGTLGQALETSSWEMWIKTTTAAQSIVIGEVSTGSSHIARVFRLNTDGNENIAPGTTGFQFRGSDGSTALRADIATDIYDDEWHHVVCVVADPNTLAVYVDGNSVSVTYRQQANLASTSDFTHAPALAADNLRGTIGSFAACSLAHVAVYPTQLSQARVQAHYAAAAAVSQVVRPDGTTTAGGWTAQGAATQHAALSDESDSSYVTGTAA